jgi:hypothetical protein
MPSCEAFFFHPPNNTRTRLPIQHTIGVVTMPADAFSALLTLESIWKVNTGMIKSDTVVCYNAVGKHEPITLDANDAE